MKIITNYHERQFKYRSEVPEAVLADDFDWLDEEEGSDGYIHYRGNWYHLSEFMRLGPIAPEQMQGWDGYISESFFSTILIRISWDGDTYQIALALS